MAHYLALSGGVGGAKLVQGLSQILTPSELTIAVNTGDDFDIYGLPVCPDIDTTLYTLAGINNTTQGWGRGDESWAFHETLQALGQAPWFQLGDRDLALHVARKNWLEQGLNLTETTQKLAAQLGVNFNVVPMSDQPIRTIIHSADRELPFQEYFVKLQAQPVVDKISFQSCKDATMSSGLQQALQHPELQGVIICPSNPYLSIDPLLSISDFSTALKTQSVPVIAVSPVVNGGAVKGPTAKIMTELGFDVTPLAIAQHYSNWLNGIVIDRLDHQYQQALAESGLHVSVTQTVMQDLQTKTELAEHCINQLKQFN